MARTRKTKGGKSKGKGAKVLKVDSADKIASMEALLKKGSITFVLIYADWCGACTRFKENIWNPMCNKSARHSRMAVRDDMVGKTSLASANFDYLPSLLVVDENGKMQSFKTPEGKDTNAMPTPQSLQEMNTIVNVPVRQSESLPISNLTPMTQVNNPALTLSVNEPLTFTPSNRTESIATQSSESKSYIPTPMVAPSSLASPAPAMKGGRRSNNLTGISKKVLKGLAALFKRSRTVKSKSKRKSKATRKSKNLR